jgi:hypothetical protein
MAGGPSIATIQLVWCKSDLTSNCGAHADDLFYLPAELTRFVTGVSQILPNFLRGRYVDKILIVFQRNPKACLCNTTSVCFI